MNWTNKAIQDKKLTTYAIKNPKIVIFAQTSIRDSYIWNVDTNTANPAIYNGSYLIWVALCAEDRSGEKLVC